MTTLTNIAAAIEGGTNIVYVTFGNEASGAWKTAKFHLSEHKLLDLFLLSDAAELDSLTWTDAARPQGWTSDRRMANGEPLGNSAPKGVFFNKGGSTAFVMTGRSALSDTWLRKAYKLATETV
ncbi:hypothetical protein [Engelhardtia mirabilis]|uniref:Uncharacterized protein n=1 Tax=Engelhardtia mirabilis TaxID=2528011 RepID=A0A518BI44_9BACT|nr:hypothetical protein Pla133_17110 [Planctomycetes bacterium Pla133]QDV00961.1 hypothetical protein Pla86_17100 [Planctomycetes bacterium Pla86]